MVFTFGPSSPWAAPPAEEAATSSPPETPSAATQCSSKQTTKMSIESLCEPTGEGTPKSPLQGASVPLFKSTSLDVSGATDVLTAQLAPDLQPTIAQKPMTPEATPLREGEPMESVLPTTEKATPSRDSERIGSERPVAKKGRPAVGVKTAHAAASGKKGRPPKRRAERDDSTNRNVKLKPDPNPEEDSTIKFSDGKQVLPIVVHASFLRHCPSIIKTLIETATLLSTDTASKIKSEFAPVKSEHDQTKISLVGNTIIIPGIDFNTLDLFKTFTYSGRVDIPDENEDNDDSDTSGEWQRLFDAWLGGIRLQCTSFMDAVTDAIVAKLSGKMFSRALSNELIAAAAPDSAMRSLLAEIVALKWNERSFEDVQFEDLDFANLVIASMGRMKGWHGLKKKAYLKKKVDCSYHLHEMSGERCYRTMR